MVKCIPCLHWQVTGKDGLSASAYFTQPASVILGSYFTSVCSVVSGPTGNVHYFDSKAGAIKKLVILYSECLKIRVNSGKR